MVVTVEVEAHVTGNGVNVEFCISDWSNLRHFESSSVDSHLPLSVFKAGQPEELE
jgi:hypothetical protein